MKEKNRRPIYEPPRARDLADNRVSGGSATPKAICHPGDAPFSVCRAGPGVTPQGACAPVGGLPVEPKCDAGSAALVGCFAGGKA